MVQAIDSRDYPTAAAAPLLIALGLAPVAAGYQDPFPALALALLIWISLLLRVGLPSRSPLRPFPLLWASLAVPLLGAVSALFSANLGSTVTHTLLLASWTAALWLAADLARHRRMEWLLGAILVGALLVGGLALREYLEHVKAGETGWRAFGQFTNPNFLAGYLVPSLLLTLAVSLRRPESFKPSTWLLALGLVTATLAGALAATGSRGGFYSLAGGAAVFTVMLLLRRSTLSRESAVRAAILAGVTLLAIGGLSAPLRERQEGRATVALPKELCPESDKSATGESNRFRLLTWKATLAMGQARPLTGWGAGSYESAFAPYALAGYTRQAHNSYLQLFAEGGAPMLAAWLILLAAAAYRLLRQARDAERVWIPGVAAALAASAVHSLFDSLLFVPAIAMLTWVLLGAATSPADAVSETASEPPARSRKKPAETVSPTAGPRWALWAGGVGFALVGVQVVGLLFLQDGQNGLSPMTARDKLATLRTAQLLLPWDIQVARAESRAQANLGLDNLDEAIRQAHRSLRIAPYRMPTYKWIGTLYKAQSRPDLALATYEQGLRHAPNEAALLYAQAEMQQELGLRKDAMQTYRRLVQVEASPVGQVRALNEHIEWRYAKAHLALSSLTPGRDNRDEPFQHRRAAACLLAQRRMLFHGNPVAYLAVEELDADLERSLRADEEKLWQRLATDFAARGDARAAELAREQSVKVDETREHLEQIIKEVHESR